MKIVQRKKGGRAYSMNIPFPLPLIEPNALASDIRRYYQDFITNGAVNSLDDPRISQKTFRGVLVKDVVRFACHDILSFFRKTQNEKAAMLNRFMFGNEFSHMNRHEMLEFTVQSPVHFHHMLLFPYDDQMSSLHSLHLAFAFPYEHRAHTKWMVVHYDFHDITITFNINDLMDAENIVYNTGNDPLFSANDNSIVFLELDHTVFDTIHGGQMHRYNNRWYKVYSNRDGSYIRTKGQKVFI